MSPKVDEVFVAPGNAGMKEVATLVNISVTDNEGLVKFAKENNVSLVVVGPEASLMNGVVDAMQKENINVFGPTKAAALIEGSKEFAKDLMKKYSIPTAEYEAFIDYEKAMEYVDKKGAPIVIKYDGLAAGKGVVVALTLDEAHQALKDMLLDKKFGNDRVIIEEYLEGPEFSLMCLVNRDKVFPLDIAQDHKRAFDHDEGPNTGGMGAYSPVPFIGKEVVNCAVETIMKKAAKGMVEEGRPFIGVLYGGLILTKDGPKVIEFNSRFGDPETEVVLPRLKNDLYEVFIDVLDGKDVELEFESNACLGVVMAAKGYPASYKKGVPISGDLKDVFHMGTSLKDNSYVTNGGRVLFVIGKGNTMEKAQKEAYNNVNKIECEDLFFRHDIGYQVIKGGK